MPDVPRVVLDTSVWISGIFFRGVPFQVLVAWRDGQIDLIFTPDTLAELETKLRAKAIEIDADFSRALPWLAYVRTFGKIYPATGTATGISRDAKDDRFLDAAISGHANYLVTGDKDLLILNEFRGVRIITPRQLLEILAAPPLE